ncbi:MAG: cell wall hydrolase [Clostridia bacterium]|nr:cell wall hydrolase [Clostridia bacterium]
MRDKFIPCLLLASSLIMCALLFPLSAVRTDTAPFSAEGLFPDAVLPQEVDCITSEEVALPILARAIETHVEGRPFAVRVAFGAVILNRVKSGGFGASVSAVLSSAGIYPADGVTPSDRSTRAAKEALAGADPTFGAVFILPETDPELSQYEDRITVRIDGLAFIR